MESVAKADQVFSVVNMKVLNMNGVKDVAECDGSRIILDTSHGRMTVEGEGIKIEKLTESGGEITVKGELCAVYMTPEKEVRRGLFGRIFG